MKGMVAWLAAFAVGMGGPAVFAADTWVEVKTPNFTIVSNSGEGTARKTAAEFEQVRAAYARIWKFVETTHIDPVVALALKDESTLRRFAPQYFEVKGGIKVVSAWVHGSRRLYLLLRT